MKGHREVLIVYLLLSVVASFEFLRRDNDSPGFGFIEFRLYMACVELSACGLCGWGNLPLAEGEHLRLVF